MPDTRLVYSTDGGDRRRDRETRAPAAATGDGIVRITREKQGRGGKVVTVVRGLPGSDADLRRVAGDLKRLCGSGGAVKDGAVELQGDHRDHVADRLRADGHRVKLAGG
jgi:translation initiation factor 1